MNTPKIKFTMALYRVRLTEDGSPYPQMQPLDELFLAFLEPFCGYLVFACFPDS